MGGELVTGPLPQTGPAGRPATLTHRDADWSGLSVVVAGLGISGSAAADALLRRGARVRVLDAGTGPERQRSAEHLRSLGGTVMLGPDAVAALPAGGAPDLLVTSPGWRPEQPAIVAAQALGVPVWGEVELAWRMRPSGGGARWLTVTGTNGKTTTVRMLTAMLTAAGLRSAAVGNVGTPVLQAVLDPAPHDVLAVELSSFQLHWLGPDRKASLAPFASALLNVEPDHLDWHGSFDAYAQAKARIYRGTSRCCVHNAQHPLTESLLRRADLVNGCRAVGFTREAPGVGSVGVIDGALVDRAFPEPGPEQPHGSGTELATLADVQGAAPVLAAHQVSNALAAATLARAAGAPPSAIRLALNGFRPDPHRIAYLDTVDGVRYVDDSKATNPPAAAASLSAFAPVVWVAGGLLKGAVIDDVVRQHAGRLRAAVLIGQDRAQISAAIRRHAADVPVVEVASSETGDMDRVVQAAAGFARPGDTVLLAPAAASLDMFRDYAERGELFAAAVARLARSRRKALG
jgi:UDP-N-acetylmuramoylalanine--D-glutamate ligase